MPTVPVKAAGWRIEPPVSVAVAARQSRAATAAAEPPEEPPGTRSPSGTLRSAIALTIDARARAPSQLGGSQGETTGPKADVSLDDPMANSSQLSLPSMTAPSRHKWLVTVNS